MFTLIVAALAVFAIVGIAVRVADRVTVDTTTSSRRVGR